jgi:squalene-associated FAD-dependent desaturase
MNSVGQDALPTVAIVGGGLAGLSAAAALSGAPCRVRLFEARRSLGGRAASFRDPATGELVDHCQHVGMGCCTNLVDFCRRTGIGEKFRRDRVMHFIGPDGRQYPFAAVDWLPAPLHLAPGFWGLKYLAVADRLSIARAFANLTRMRVVDDPNGPTIAEWLAANGQSPAAIDGFWRVILVSALGESLERSSLAAARKVIVDGFLSARESYQIDVPEAPLGELYGDRLARWLRERGVEVQLGSAVRHTSHEELPRLALATGESVGADYVIVAVPWSKLTDVVDRHVTQQWPWVEAMAQLASAPITGVHLWFDRPIMNLPHAVLVGRLAPWIFNRGWRQASEDATGYYYQVVISASYALADRDRHEIAAQVCDELTSIWPEAVAARLLHGRVVTEQGAVFSPRPGLESLRPPQQTSCPRLFLAGDWTKTGWPATMESAVRSGYLAAEGVCRALGQPQSFVVADLPRGLLARMLIR